MNSCFSRICCPFFSLRTKYTKDSAGLFNILDLIECFQLTSTGSNVTYYICFNKFHLPLIFTTCFDQPILSVCCLVPLTTRRTFFLLCEILIFLEVTFLTHCFISSIPRILSSFVLHLDFCAFWKFACGPRKLFHWRALDSSISETVSLQGFIEFLIFAYTCFSILQCYHTF